MQSWKKVFCHHLYFQPSLQELTVIRSEFSDQQIKLFETRYSEGYDIFEDEEYILWLKSYHPEAIPSNLDSKVANDDYDEAEQWQQNIEFIDVDEQDETLQHDHFCGMYFFDLPSCHSIVNKVSRMDNSTPNLQ